MDLTTSLEHLPTVAVAITTHNRLVELRRTCSVIAALEPPPHEFLICADGCTDETVSFIRAEFPEVNLIIHETPRGSIPSRNELFRHAHSDIILSIDDDSHPIDRDAMRRIAEFFAEYPRLAVASLAQRSNEFPQSLQAQHFGESRLTGTFINCAAAISRKAFMELGGYTAMFQHMYEEPDFALRCLASGWEVRWQPDIVIRHFWTPSQRSEMRVHHRHSRNEAWSVIMRCPSPFWPIILAYRVVRQFQYAIKRGPQWVIQEPKWWFWFLQGVPAAWRQRQPVPWTIYRAWLHSLRAS